MEAGGSNFFFFFYNSTGREASNRNENRPLSCLIIYDCVSLSTSKIRRSPPESSLLFCRSLAISMEVRFGFLWETLDRVSIVNNQIKDLMIVLDGTRRFVREYFTTRHLCKS